jgi:DNA-directed RNA polymerase specialized sigma24 family protein
MTEDGGAGFIGQADTNTMRDGPLVIDLVTRERTGDKRSWDALVERYAPLIWSICCRYRLDRADAEDVGQSVWLRLVDQLDKIRCERSLVRLIRHAIRYRTQQSSSLPIVQLAATASTAP